MIRLSVGNYTTPAARHMVPVSMFALESNKPAIFDPTELDTEKSQILSSFRANVVYDNRLINISQQI